MSDQSLSSTPPSTTSIPQTDSDWRTISLEDPNLATEWQKTSQLLWNDDAYNSCLTLYDKFLAVAEENDHIHSALSCLHDAYRLYTPRNVITSFNGGKDATVVAYLAWAALAHYYDETSTTTTTTTTRYQPRAIYFDHNDEFPQVRSFCRSTAEQYQVRVWAFAAGTPFADGLRVLVDDASSSSSSSSGPLAIVLGTRQGDPNAVGQGKFEPSSASYMPPFLRVNPILDWDYGKVWDSLRSCGFEYCSLYDEGYTSLGTTKDTLPCPALRVVDDSTSTVSYLPAYMLQDWDQERAGRIPKKKKKSVEAAVTPNDATTAATHMSTALLSSSDEVSNLGGSQHENSTAGEQQQQPNDVFTTTTTTTTIQTTVALLMIGDEILKGFVHDTNTGVAARALKDHNVVLTTVVVVSDRPEAIVPEIRRLRKQVDVVITSGGVGPTHDDVTLHSIAAALECRMVWNAEMAAVLQRGQTTTDGGPAQIKMATLPECAKLRYFDASGGTSTTTSNNNTWPILQCSNIFVLPGIPALFENKIQTIARYLSYHIDGLSYKIVLQLDEVAIVDTLNEIVSKYDPWVKIGSYPQPDADTTVLTVEGEPYADATVRKALDDLLQQLPDKSVVRVSQNMALLED